MAQTAASGTQGTSPRRASVVPHTSRPEMRHASPPRALDAPPGFLYSGNPVRQRFQPVLGSVASEPPPEAGAVPLQLMQPFVSEGEGSMVPMHVAYTQADLWHWHNLQQQIAHRTQAPLAAPDHDVHDRAPAVPRPDDRLTAFAPAVPRPGVQDTIGWAAVAVREGRTDVHPSDTEAKAALTHHLSPDAAWNTPWQFDETLGAGTAHPIVPIAGLSEEKTAAMNRAQRRRYRVRLFMLQNVFVPLLCRAVNIMVLSCTLGIGARLRYLLTTNDSEMAVGVSPLAAIIFSPPSIVHAFVQIWVEYFSRPIGLWQLSSKLWYTALELIFICLWSAELALSMDNYFTSTIVCINASSPFYANANQFRTHLAHPETKGSVCRLQVALICVVFVSVVVYLFVFMVSLFRIFHRIRT